jgi:hypothetical protein
VAIRRAKQKQQVIEKLQAIAPPGETFEACVHCETGVSPWLGAALDEIPLVGLIIAVTRRYYFLTLTSQHVVLNAANRFTNRPGEVLGSWPRDAFPISRVKRGKVWSVAYVQFANSTTPTRLNIHRYWRTEFDQLVAGTSAGAPAAAAAVPPPPPPPPPTG